MTPHFPKGWWILPALATMVIGLGACTSQQGTTEAQVEAGRKPVPYTRRTVLPAAPPTSFADDYFDRMRKYGEAGVPPLPVPPSTPSSTTTLATASTDDPSTSSSSSSTTSTIPDEQLCKQYSQFLQFIDEMVGRVDSTNPSATAANMSAPMAASRRGLEQLASQPAPAVAGPTVVVLNWLNNKARGAAADDKAFEDARTSLAKWYEAEC